MKLGGHRICKKIYMNVCMCMHINSIFKDLRYNHEPKQGCYQRTFREENSRNLKSETRKIKHIRQIGRLS